MKKLSLILVLTLPAGMVSFSPAGLAEESTYEQTLFDQSNPIGRAPRH